MKLVKLLFVLLLLTNCSSDTTDTVETINIRILNASLFDYQDIKVDTSTGLVDFGSLNSGVLSEYQSFELAYSYAFVELLIDGEVYTLQPIDYVGETPLENGNYTYAISAEIKDRYDTLSLNLMYDVEPLEDNR
ncbi:MAG: hypothetical protein QNJ57_09530 [Flavobacteriaceae bacterium]|nr:hypothetical protein [Flavobacteriaceae bacterium]